MTFEMSKEGPIIRGIVFAEFHPTAGPKIVFQIPDEIITREEYEAVYLYIIPKEQLTNRTITINFSGNKIIGCLVCIGGSKYERNELVFNCCFVVNALANSANYENAVKKLAAYLTKLELETKEGFISNEKNREKLPNILKVLLNELNDFGRSHLMINGTTALHIQVDASCNDRTEVKNHEVPVFISSISMLLELPFESTLPCIDLIMKQIIPLIDGDRHVARISYESDVDLYIVKSCIKKLMEHGAVKLIPVFQYTNVYTSTAAMNSLVENQSLQELCIASVALPGKSPLMGDVFHMFCSLVPGTTVRDVCQRFNPRSHGIDERALVQFGLTHGFIRRLHKYPICVASSCDNSQLTSYSKRISESYFTGQLSYDEICSRTGISYKGVEERVESDSSIVVCWK